MLKLLLAAVACYAALALVVYLMQARMLYLAGVPGRSLDHTPADIGVEYRDEFIATEDGVRLHGWYIRGDSDRVLLFFPDPWPKKKHHKRRIVQPAFVALIARKLKTGGLFHMATDWEPYAEHMLEVMQASPAFVNCEGGNGRYAARPDYRPVTKFERRGQRLGHGVWDLLYRRA